MDNKIKNLSTNETYMIVHGQLSGKDNINSIKSTKQFWISQKLHLPILFKFALRVLSIPASSA
ncbi:hypothetical protein BpHYR1_018557 [Brachionus plicatilis]|uniref:HAT C-terminal dimerisation domain-containing protein n=1 Tax=Brachionus plicatilis TaxID=10195 RepID=A0A3M7PPA0_BRAPC|nr:hypothetical protein BpHYR1_018557 [Brachionus plicatilis]